jgi:hypothetical protein
MAITFGITINERESQSPNMRTPYFRRSFSDNFTVSLKFKGWTEYNSTVSWFVGYAQLVAGAPTGTTPMTVSINQTDPAWRGHTIVFTRTGVPVIGLSFGDQVGQFVYDITLQFVGTSNANSVTAISDTNTLTTPPTSWTTASRYFFPNGTQPGSTVQYGATGALYDVITPKAASTPVITNLTTVIAGRDPHPTSVTPPAIGINTVELGR